MGKSYYQQPSDLGLPIIKLFISNPNGECRQTIYAMERKFNWGFNLSSMLKYLWRLGQKSDDITSDLEKAAQYLEWELESPVTPLSEDTRNTIVTALNMLWDLQQSDANH
jgi:Protein of unknwon function (DUF3310)